MLLLILVRVGSCVVCLERRVFRQLLASCQPAPSLTTLPDDVLLHTFSFLPAQDTANIQRVSKRVKDVAQSPQLWEAYVARDFRQKVRRAQGVWL